MYGAWNPEAKSPRRLFVRPVPGGLKSVILAAVCATAVFGGGLAVGAVAGGDNSSKVTTSPRPPDTRKVAEQISSTTAAPRLVRLSQDGSLPQLRKEPVAPASPAQTSGSTTSVPPPATSTPPPATTPPSETEPVCC
jgi:hypothetical protein